MAFDFRPIADALAERGRVVVRRAYADWSYFDEDRRMLTRSHVELIEMPQRMGASRKNAADIKMAVDALELAFERDYISTFVICTGDSDFTPLVHKLRELNKRVIGVGVEKSTSALLPPACDEFLYYDRLEGVEIPPRVPGAAARPGRPAPEPQPVGAGARAPAGRPRNPARDVDTLAVLVAQTVAGLQGSSSGAVTASTLKRTLLRKDPTFNESDYGFRTFGELLRHLAERNVVELAEGPAKGDPEVSLPEHGDREAAFALLRSVVARPGRRRRRGGAVRSEEPASQGTARLQREEARLPQLPPVLQGGRHQRRGRSAVEPRRRRLPAHREGALTRAAGSVAQPLPGEELRHHHPPRLRHQLGHLGLVQPGQVAAHPVEPQVGLAREEEQLGLRGDEAVPLLLRVAETHRLLVPGERDVHDGADAELHPVVDQVLGRARQRPGQGADIGDSYHGSDGTGALRQSVAGAPVRRRGSERRTRTGRPGRPGPRSSRRSTPSRGAGAAGRQRQQKWNGHPGPVVPTPRQQTDNQPGQGESAATPRPAHHPRLGVCSSRPPPDRSRSSPHCARPRTRQIRAQVSVRVVNLRADLA